MPSRKKLSKADEGRALEQMLDLLADARLLGREGRSTAEIRRHLGVDISASEIARLGGARLVNNYNLWALTEDELQRRLADGSELYARLTRLRRTP